MEIKLFLDKNRNPIDAGKVYMDTINGVSDIHITEQDGSYFAKPYGLDAEPLEDVCSGLVIQE